MLYEKFEKNWRIWLWIPIILLILSIGIIANNIMTTGSFMKRDTEFGGGKSITFEVTSSDINAIKAELPDATVKQTSGVIKNVIVDIPYDGNETKVIDAVNRHAQVEGKPSVISVGPAIGEIFFQQAQLAMILAFIFMGIVVFILFRSPVPSLIVLLSAATDILVTIGALDLLGVALSLPVMAALLTLIGYSVDTDLLLTSELLKGKHDEISHGIKRAMKTGLTFTATTLTALLAMYFVSGSVVIEQIAFVLLIGLLIDVPSTWLTNAGVLRFWLERKRHE